MQYFQWICSSAYSEADFIWPSCSEVMTPDPLKRMAFVV